MGDSVSLAFLSSFCTELRLTLGLSRYFQILWFPELYSKLIMFGTILQEARVVFSDMASLEMKAAMPNCSREEALSATLL